MKTALRLPYLMYASTPTNFLQPGEHASKTLKMCTALVEHYAATHSPVNEASEEPSASCVECNTRDFVLEALQERITHRQFEELSADVLRVSGYQARVTVYSQDGEVDVIAHKDPLAVEPTLIKVQCKHKTAPIDARYLCSGSSTRLTRWRIGPTKMAERRTICQIFRN